MAYDLVKPTDETERWPNDFGKSKHEARLMGGSGSGKRSNKDIVDECLAFGLSGLLRSGHLTGSSSTYEVSWTNYRGATVYWLTVDVRPMGDWLTLYLRQTGQTITLESTALSFGGWRWWFLCPKCRRRCGKLHLPQQNGKFACRLCHDLIYESSRQSYSTPAFGFAGGVVPKAITAAKRERRGRWVRKRNRRPDYKPRG